MLFSSASTTAASALTATTVNGFTDCALRGAKPLSRWPLELDWTPPPLVVGWPKDSSTHPDQTQNPSFSINLSGLFFGKGTGLNPQPNSSRRKKSND
jgi:hypothetical protein